MNRGINPILSRAQAAQVIGISTRQMDRILRTEDGPHAISIGRRVMVHEDELQHYLRRKSVKLGCSESRSNATQPAQPVHRK
jgi:hypothetical protein